ncbi:MULTISPECIES: hypothetical protein [Spirulina sp. CCY15215]|uniref:hypothetical protein n=1 Tax=Spirulina sp. CCY15215 TaxID=2767591 RepID=UPI001951E7DA|nr:hypothetical protein [Spirulina major]
MIFDYKRNLRLTAAIITLLFTGCATPSRDIVSNSLENKRDRLLQPVAQTQTLPLTNLETEWGISLPKVDDKYKNFWTPELEAEFQQRTQIAIEYYAGKQYGTTYGEREKQAYPLAMLDFLAGNREKAIAALQAEDVEAERHQHTQGIDYYYSFTLKGQIRKYFLWGTYLDPAYKQRMFDGAKEWTKQDPKTRPHPVYGHGDRSLEGWDMSKQGNWVDGRNTDNLRGMRDIAIYLMAEETGNEETRQLYKQKIQRYVWALYHIGMGEWDSPIYHGHTFASYLNLYDFAKDTEMKVLAKAALDWLSTAAAVKYYRGGWGGPNKRDSNGTNVVYGAGAASLFWLYFGDVTDLNPKPERDSIHIITSSYRPPQAVIALARKQFNKPVELLATKPVYENWQEGGEDRPGYWETTFFGYHYQMGSIVSDFPDGDVAPFKIIADNADRGSDIFLANTGGKWAQPGKKPGDAIAQFRNLLIWLRPANNTPFFLQIPKTANAEIEQGIWFFQLDRTWLALRPIGLDKYTEVSIENKKYQEAYSEEITLKAEIIGDRYAGFVLEVGESETHGNYAQFKRNVKGKNQLNLQDLATGTVELQGTLGNTLSLSYQDRDRIPLVKRNGEIYNRLNHFELYRSLPEGVPISLGWKQGTLRVEAGGKTFTSTVTGDGKVE